VPSRLQSAVPLRDEFEERIGPLRGTKGRGLTLAHGHEGLAAYVAGRLADRLGTPLTPLAASAEGRAAQTEGPTAARCGPAPMVAMNAAARPTPLLPVTPIHPGPDLQRGAGSEVLLTAELTEHGTLARVRRVGGIEGAKLVAAAMGAATLWRFRVPEVDGCPARREVTLAMSFAIQRG
jgi:hypothetical protein